MSKTLIVTFVTDVDGEIKVTLVENDVLVGTIETCLDDGWDMLYSIMDEIAGHLW